MEFLKHKLSIAKAPMQQNAHISIEEGLVDLAAKLEIQIHSLEIANNNWNVKITTIIKLYKSFLDKYSLIIPTQ